MQRSESIQPRTKRQVGAGKLLHYHSLVFIVADYQIAENIHEVVDEWLRKAKQT